MRLHLYIPYLSPRMGLSVNFEDENSWVTLMHLYSQCLLRAYSGCRGFRDKEEITPSFKGVSSLVGKKVWTHINMASDIFDCFVFCSMFVFPHINRWMGSFPVLASGYFQAENRSCLKLKAFVKLQALWRKGTKGPRGGAKREEAFESSRRKESWLLGQEAERTRALRVMKEQKAEEREARECGKIMKVLL